MSAEAQLTEAPQSRSYLALAISGLFHPLLVPTYIFLILAGVNPYLFGTSDLGEPRAMSNLILIFLDTFVIPVVAVVIMAKLNMINSVMMHEKSERIGPLLLVMVLYFWIYYNFSQSNQTPTIFSSFLLGVIIALVAGFVINLLDKISLHATGMGGLVAVAVIMLALFGPNGIEVGAATIGLPVLLVLTVIIAGAVGTARLALGAHDRMQLYAGYLLGFVSQFVALKFYF
ncbi:hypothetical protein GGR26_002781 [Lewinella marina]|uniref:Uncharacterized protein n=1 Tax=Neolewinella marina TaxID=438751 RepID=A0A2G0CCU7_9BACT|nr:hypothetical protein [Neolewinella marina]NJB87004.1 hypothetical protein [Neolewinella marina]PHK97803.1 hypothetical protein CGL56_13380 [Neolewinella marina]